MGAAVEIAGGVKARTAAGVIFSRRRGSQLEIVVAISNDRAAAERLARSAAD
jgi:protein involved in polysaccharide export with SLBB domain